MSSLQKPNKRTELHVHEILKLLGFSLVSVVNINRRAHKIKGNAGKGVYMQSAKSVPIMFCLNHF